MAPGTQHHVATGAVQGTFEPQYSATWDNSIVDEVKKSRGKAKFSKKFIARLLDRRIHDTCLRVKSLVRPAISRYTSFITRGRVGRMAGC